MLDDDELLTEEDKARPDVPAAGGAERVEKREHTQPRAHKLIDNSHHIRLPFWGTMFAAYRTPLQESFAG